MCFFVIKLSGDGITIRLWNIIKAGSYLQMSFIQAPITVGHILDIQIILIIPNFNIPRINMLTGDKIHNRFIVSGIGKCYSWDKCY